MTYYLQHYVVDWEKVQTLDDLKAVLAAMQIAFSPTQSTLPSIRHLVRLEDESWPSVPD